MPKDWKNESIDDILNYNEAHTGRLHRYGRIMRQFEIDALKEVRAGLFDVKKAVLAASGQLGNDVTDFSKTVSRATAKQGKFQKATIALTVVIALASVLYTWVTWQSVLAQREANEIQRIAIQAEPTDIANEPAVPESRQNP